MLTQQLTRGAATFEPVSLDEAKVQIRLTANDFDAELAHLITAARQTVEHDTGMTLSQATCSQCWDAWPSGNVFELLTRPVQSITSITYLDVDGASQTLSASLYALDATRVHPVIQPTYNAVFPPARLINNAITATYVAGYAAASSIPAPLKRAMLLLIGHWFNVREAVNIGNITSEVPLTYESLVRRYFRATYP